MYLQKLLNMKYIITFFTFVLILSNTHAQEADTYFKEALAAMEAASYQEAIKKMDLAIKADKAKDAFKYGARGLAYLKAGEFRNAISDLKTAIKLNQSNPDFYFYKGTAEDSLKRYPDALQSINKAIKLSSGDAKLYIGRAHIFTAVKDYHSALSNLNYAIQLDEKNGTAYFLRALAKFNLVDSVGACQDWKQAQTLGYQESSTWIEKHCQKE